MASEIREPATEWDWQPGAEGVHTEQRLRVSQPLFCVMCGVKQA